MLPVPIGPALRRGPNYELLRGLYRLCDRGHQHQLLSVRSYQFNRKGPNTSRNCERHSIPCRDDAGSLPTSNSV